ncbi:1-deoxy-D-xylulose-5-phosphate synthase [Pseudolactococcus insecticola]|uniref:1-deoxy-D-xylulose-5-phosphate synthase n=1 Tax=Pseudolactococcus insecticola TaxID=2709158 RepID=A0A6A0B833_9LACT|nr:1-deoxy-D-xylulose-5-phosphate synthase [Lactococcus insecticola]GFH40514.1 1-deoxy-D-xylulose-5-phosphate synthase [Lactococcus insecticola]
MTILDKVNSPADIKTLPSAELNELASDVRAAIIHRDSQVGGHLGPNLGVVEMTIALHKVFNSPTDKLIWDVSHQSYPHKILTGRKAFFTDSDKLGGTTGYTDPKENEHDFIRVGHTSTSVATAVGYAKARDLQGKQENIIAIIGDGALSGGLAFEGLDGAGDFKNNLIVILNDNEWAIDENHGGMYRHLAALRESNGTLENNLFKSFGLDYKYLDAGNDIEKLTELFESVKDIDHPIVLHIHTKKGNGYQPAIENPVVLHQMFGPFNPETGEYLDQTAPGRAYDDVIGEFMEDKLASGDKLVAITAAIPMFFGLMGFAQKHPENYIDGGIAEQYTVTLGGAIAKAGTRAFIFQYATFLQRAYDQLNHDLALNEEPAIVIVKGGMIGGNNDTHQGSFVNSITSNIPNIIDLAPASEADLKAMLNWAYNQHEHPVIIHLSERGFETRPTRVTNFSQPSYELVKSGEGVAILGLGGMLTTAEAAADELAKVGVNATVVNPHSINQVDTAVLDKLAETHSVFVTLEDGAVDGGFGQKVASYLSQKGVKVLVKGADTIFIDNTPQDELFTTFRLTPALIAEDVKAAFEQPEARGFIKKLFSK